MDKGKEVSSRCCQLNMIQQRPCLRRLFKTSPNFYLRRRKCMLTQLQKLTQNVVDGIFFILMKIYVHGKVVCRTTAKTITTHHWKTLIYVRVSFSVRIGHSSFYAWWDKIVNRRKLHPALLTALHSRFRHFSQFYCADDIILNGHRYLFMILIHTKNKIGDGYPHTVPRLVLWTYFHNRLVSVSIL